MNKKLIAREWVRVFEEETGGQEVFRPSGSKLPPARGREKLDLRSASGSRAIPGADDRYVETAGSWLVSDDCNSLEFLSDGEEAPAKSYDILSVDADRMVLRRKSAK